MTKPRRIRDVDTGYWISFGNEDKPKAKWIADSSYAVST